MGRRGRVDDEAAHVADVRHVAVQDKPLHELLAGIEPADDLEGEHAAGSARRVLLAEGMPRARGQPRVVDRDHLRTCLEPRRDRERVVNVTFHAQ